LSKEVKKLGPYKILERIGTGGMATVYRSEMKTNDGVSKIVALKILHPHLAEEDAFVQMFLKECKLAAQLRHENIVSPFDFGEIDGVYYMAMDYHRGLNLRSILELLREQNLTLSLESGIFVLAEVLQGLRHAHRFTDPGGEIREIIHRDVSPQNILVTTQGEVKLIDFGIAKIMGETGLTDIGTIKGKIQYMSPEQAAGKVLDKRTDLYSLAVVAYEVFTGDMLFPQRDPTRVLRQIQLGDVRFSDEFEVLPPKLQKVLRRALHRTPSRRCADAKTFRNELLDITRSSGQKYLPKKTMHELGALTKTLMDPAVAEAEEIRLPTSLLEQESEASPAARSESVSSSYRMGDSSWARLCAYVCGALIILALLLEIMGLDLRPAPEPGAVLNERPVVTRTALREPAPKTLTRQLKAKKDFPKAKKLEEK